MVLLWRWWLGLRVVVLGLSKGRGFAASFFSTTPKPPLRGLWSLRSYALTAKIKAMTVHFPLGIWLAEGKWFYLGGGGWD